MAPTTEGALGNIDAVLTQLGLRCRHDALRTSYRDDRNLIAVTYTDPADPLREVDILVSPPIAPADLVRRAITLQLDDIPVSVIAIEDLIAIKRASGRPQDLAEVAHLERIAGGKLDE